MTQNIKISLSTSGLKQLSKELQAYKLFLNKQTKEALSDLVLLGTTDLSRRTSGLTDYDGNDAGYVDSVFTGTKGVISNIGPQIAFLEFGTGIRGQESPHPNASLVGWDYNTKTSKKAHRTVGGVEGWFYFNQTQGRAVFTPGIRPYGQMLYTSIYLRGIAIPTFVGKVKRGV